MPLLLKLSAYSSSVTPLFSGREPTRVCFGVTASRTVSTASVTPERSARPETDTGAVNRGAGMSTRRAASSHSA